MYDGDDRVRQVNALDQLAEDIYSGLSDDEMKDGILAADILYIMSEGRLELPRWFDGHDLDYLAAKVARAKGMGRP